MIEMNKKGAFRAHQELESALDAIASEVVAREGECVFRQGMSPKGVYLVRSGSARVYIDAPNGGEMADRVVGPGSMLGVPATLSSHTHVSTVRSLGELRLGFVEAERFAVFLRQRPDLCMHVVSLISAELTDINQTRAFIQESATQSRRPRGVSTPFSINNAEACL
jgi:CRP-like cAMP-binding protein